MDFLNKFLNDSEKSVNPAWVITGLLTVAIIAWGCWEAYHTHAMPNRLSDAAYLLAGASGTNLAHKAEDMIAKFRGAPTPPSPPSV